VSLLSRARLRASAVLLALTGALGLLATAAPPAQAMTAYESSVLRQASLQKGKPYQYGAAGPSRFDCSGYTLYVFKKFGKTLPHSSSMQYSRVRHISKSYRRAGDLVFFKNSSGRIYHVGIYAGSNRIWHAPHSGSTVRLATIWTSSYVVGRP
jgi:cell wall-associated NlpC family hydrolase